MTDDTEPDIAERTDPDGWHRYAFNEHGKCVVLTGKPVVGDGWVWWRWTSRVTVDTEEQARNLVMG